MNLHHRTRTLLCLSGILFLVTLLLATTPSSAEDPPPTCWEGVEEECTTETSVFVCAPYPIPECFDPPACPEGTTLLEESCHPPAEIGDPLGPIDNPDLPEVPEEGQEAMDSPDRVVAPPARPIASGTLPYTG